MLWAQLTTNIGDKHYINMSHVMHIDDRLDSPYIWFYTDILGSRIELIFPDVDSKNLAAQDIFAAIRDWTQELKIENFEEIKFHAIEKI